nr:1626_t:CDS:1 [Entrophospora candida]
METIFGIHHDTASLREKNDAIQKSKNKGIILNVTSSNSIDNNPTSIIINNEKGGVKKLSVNKSLDDLINNKNATNATIATATTLKSLLRFVKSPTLSPHSTPPTSAPGTPFEEITLDKLMLGSHSTNNNNNTNEDSTTAPLAKTTATSYHSHQH